MRISFEPFSDALVELAYEDYRAAGLDDSPTRPFQALSQAEKENEIRRCKAFRRVIVVDGEQVGWIGIRPRLEERRIHVGFALFAEFRGKGLMKHVLRERLELFVREEYPAISDRFPSREIFATTAPTNVASQRTLLACGFFKVDEVLEIEDSPDARLLPAVIFLRRF